MILKAFLGGFCATTVFLALIASDPATREQIQASRPVTLAPAQNQDARVAASTIAQPSASTLALNACNQRLAAPFEAFGLRFDHRSEQLKAESRQLIYSIIEISADCPEAQLGILAPSGSTASLEQLARRRTDALIKQFRRGGLSAEGIANDTALESAGDWRLQFFVP